MIQSVVGNKPPQETQVSRTELGIYLETVRNGLRLSRDRVAEAVGTSRAQIMRIEKGQQEPGATQLARIAGFLHINGERIFELLRTVMPPDEVRRIAHADLVELLKSHTFDELRGGNEKPSGPG
jgi:transcriptional regulator with XRE-family HTH domain